MLAFLTAQVLICAYAFLVAQKESVTIKAFRDYVPMNHPYNDPFHGYGFLARGVPLIMASLFQSSVLGYVCAPVVCALLLWVVFDAVIGDEVYDNPYYLGSTSRIDKWLWDTFGKNAGKRKVQYALVGVVVINLLYLFV